jgi:hypothetical protein
MACGVVSDLIEAFLASSKLIKFSFVYLTTLLQLLMLRDVEWENDCECLIEKDVEGSRYGVY